MTTKDVLALALEALTHTERDLRSYGYSRFHWYKIVTEAITAIKQAQEPVAWEATTPAYIKYVTDKQYRLFSDAARRHYKPYKCSSCAAPKQAEQAQEPAPEDAHPHIYGYAVRGGNELVHHTKYHSGHHKDAIALIAAPKQAEPAVGFGKIVGTHGKVEEWPTL
jgi:hypothetical protein